MCTTGQVLSSVQGIGLFGIKDPYDVICYDMIWYDVDIHMRYDIMCTYDIL